MYKSKSTARKSAFISVSAIGLMSLFASAIQAQDDYVHHDTGYPTGYPAPYAAPMPYSPVSMYGQNTPAPSALPYVMTPNATAAGTVPLMTGQSSGPYPAYPTNAGLASYSPVSYNPSQYVPAPIDSGLPTISPNARYEMNPYQGPVQHVPATQAAHRLPPQYLQGRILPSYPNEASYNMPMPASAPLPSASLSDLKPIETPVTVPSESDLDLPPVVEKHSYVLAKGLIQSPDVYSWNDANAGAVANFVNTQNDSGVTAIFALGRNLQSLPISGISVELEVSHRFAQSTNGQSGKHKVLGGAVNLIKRVSPSPKYELYGGVGGGVAYVRHKNISGGGITNPMTDESTAPMFSGFGGVSINLKHNLALLGEVRRMYVHDVKRQNDGGGVSKSSYSATEGGIGFKYNF
ncbi:MAG: hypothetical protein ACPGVN_08335 [Alphaproteobacteria bacterium]